MLGKLKAKTKAKAKAKAKLDSNARFRARVLATKAGVTTPLWAQCKGAGRPTKAQAKAMSKSKEKGTKATMLELEDLPDLEHSYRGLQRAEQHLKDSKVALEFALVAVTNITKQFGKLVGDVAKHQQLFKRQQKAEDGDGEPSASRLYGHVYV